MEGKNPFMFTNEKENCCGCTACYNICPQNAISMISDEEGFLYPEINETSCISCGLCEKACPMKMTINAHVGISTRYAIQCKDNKKRFQSTAGGFFSIVADYVIGKNGEVFAAGYGEYAIVHKRATFAEELEEMRGSKYVQSNLRECFRQIYALLQQNKYCLFVGTPCQVYGLKSFLKSRGLKIMDCLITIDLLCLGVSSPMLYLEWLKYLEKKYKDKVTTVCFRDKSYGYSTSNVRVYFQNRKAIEQCNDAKSLMKSFFLGYNMRPSCYDCKFRCVDRAGDFTIGDLHDIDKYSKELDDDKGTTSVWINSNRGDYTA